jgi:hypothetical protein
MSSKLTCSRFAVASFISGLLCVPLAVGADTQGKQGEAQTSLAPTAKTQHRVHRTAKKPLPPPLPSGPRGPVPQIPLDAMPAVAPEVTFQDGMLTISAPNSTLGDILRGVRKQTSADIDVPANANERVAMHLGPAPPREVMADLLNGSRFNYILLGSPQNSNALVRVVLVAKTGPDNPEPQSPTQANANSPQPAKTDPDAAEAVDTVDESVDQAATEADETPSDEPGVKTPQQMLQEMQQRQLQMQQQQQQQNGNGQPVPGYPPPGGVMPQRPPMNPQTPQQPQDQ